jgi:hypothetical protein
MTKPFETLKVGDKVLRLLGGSVPMWLHVTGLTDTLITCADWTFDRTTGAEIDEYLGWGPPPLMTGSFLDPSGVWIRTSVF